MSALLLLILPTYALLAITTYVWSLGGFKFHIFPHEVDDISIEVTKRYFALPLVFVIICVIIYLAAGIHGVTIFTKLWMLDLEKWFGFYYAPVFLAYQGVQTVFAFLYSVIGFANRAKKVEKIEE